MKSEEPNNQPSSKENTDWKKLASKKWFFPAVYVSVTALVLGMAWWYQGQQLKQVSTQDFGMMEPSEDAMDSSQLMLPVGQDSEAMRKIGFYDEATSVDEKQSALVKYLNTYRPHTGCDFARKDGNTFDVVAVMDGKVVQVNEHPIVGRQIEIQHKDGLVSVYQSLQDIDVKQGQTVQRGFVIAKAARNAFEKDLGNHLHFEIRKNNTTQNPEQYFVKN